MSSVESYELSWIIWAQLNHNSNNIMHNVYTVFTQIFWETDKHHTVYSIGKQIIYNQVFLKSEVSIKLCLMNPSPYENSWSIGEKLNISSTVKSYDYSWIIYLQLNYVCTVASFIHSFKKTLFGNHYCTARDIFWTNYNITIFKWRHSHK